MRGATRAHLRRKYDYPVHSLSLLRCPSAAGATAAAASQWNRRRVSDCRPTDPRSDSRLPPLNELGAWTGLLHWHHRRLRRIIISFFFSPLSLLLLRERDEEVNSEARGLCKRYTRSSAERHESWTTISASFESEKRERESGEMVRTANGLTAVTAAAADCSMRCWTLLFSLIVSVSQRIFSLVSPDSAPLLPLLFAAFFRTMICCSFMSAGAAAVAAAGLRLVSQSAASN